MQANRWTQNSATKVSLDILNTADPRYTTARSSKALDHGSPIVKLLKFYKDTINKEAQVNTMALTQPAWKPWVCVLSSGCAGLWPHGEPCHLAPRWPLPLVYLSRHRQIQNSPAKYNVSEGARARTHAHTHTHTQKVDACCFELFYCISLSACHVYFMLICVPIIVFIEIGLSDSVTLIKYLLTYFVEYRATVV